MLNNNIHLTIITLSKNDNKKLLRTLKSVNSQKINMKVEWLIVDGSSKIFYKKNDELIKTLFNHEKEKYLLINHIHSNVKRIFGIYPCMNFAKKISKGKFIIFLNGGDQFYNKNSLQIILDNTLNELKEHTLIFGQAHIIASSKLNWFFPGNELSNFKKWIQLFEPNHQAMIISNSLANIIDFPTNMESISDGYWKRLIINNSQEIIYINKPIIKFFLDGVSTIKPSSKEMLKILKNEKIYLTRKIIFLIKYLFPKRLFFLYHKLQKYKSLLVDFIF